MGHNKWILSLRRNPNQREDRNKFTFINIGKDSKPLYTMFNENYNKSPEFITSPFHKTELPKIGTIAKTKLYNDTKEKFNISIEQRMNLNDLKVNFSYFRLKEKIF